MIKYETSSRLNRYSNLEDEPDAIGEESKIDLAKDQDHPFKNAGFISQVCNSLFSKFEY